MAFGFLLSAPATNLPTLLWILQAGGPVVTLLFALLLSFLSVVLSYVVDWSEVDLLVGTESGEMPVLPEWFTILSPYLVGTLLVMGLVRKCSTSIGLSLIHI